MSFLQKSAIFISKRRVLFQKTVNCDHLQMSTDVKTGVILKNRYYEKFLIIKDHHIQVL